VTDAIRKEISYEERLKVREVTLDMSPTMDFIVGELFPQAKRTLDRFHVTSNVLEDIQSIRMRIKTLTKDEELKKEEQCKIDRKKYIPKKLENSETKLDFITRLRYQLFERRKDWCEYQVRRWEVLKQHSEFDEIQVAYELLEKFYEIPSRGSPFMIQRSRVIKQDHSGMSGFEVYLDTNQSKNFRMLDEQ